MSHQNADPKKPLNNREMEPKAIKRTRAFMEERLIGDGNPENNGGLRRADEGDLATRSKRIGQYRALQAIHNPVFPGANNGISSGNLGRGNTNPGFLIGGKRVPDSLLPGHFYPLGPAALLLGQGNTRPTGSGRVTSLAIGNDGQRIYAGAANGGVWRSDNGGMSWRPLMNGVHFAPITAQSDSLAIGAVVMDTEQPDRIFVGTGEGPGRVSVEGAPLFFGVGPLYSEDGGYTWQAERVDSEGVTGSAYFKMVLDPDDPQKVTAATRNSVMQRQPRNRRLESEFKPQVYFFRYDLNSWDLTTFYLGEDGLNTTQAWTGGGGYLEKNDQLVPFVLNGRPFFLQYNIDTGIFDLNIWAGNGAPANTLTTDAFANNLGKDWSDFLPVTLLGRAFIVSYNSHTGLATLWFLEIKHDIHYRATAVWENRNWGKSWTNLIPVEILGQAYFITYNLASGKADLQLWLPNGETVRIWRKTLGAGLRFMAFHIKAESFLLQVSSQDGSGVLNRWNSDGSLDQIRDFSKGTFIASVNLQLVSYQFEGRARFYSYDLTTGAANSYRFTADMNIQLLASQQWGKNFIIKGFRMGFEWVVPQFDPQPNPSKNLVGPETPTASGLAVAKSANVIHYFAAFWDDKVYRSIDGGGHWRILGTGFPSNSGRITLATQPDNRDVVYAFLQQGLVYRWDSSDNKWRKISGVPPKSELVRNQGDYDLAMVVAPNDVDTIYLGGAALSNSAALYRCKVNFSKGTVFNSVSMVPTWIGNSVHADIHALDFIECKADRLWVGCDGGVFSSDKVTSTVSEEIESLFEARNCGLSTQTVNFMGQHPTEDAVLYCGTQDNGGQLFIGASAWRLASFNDCGHVLIDWSDPKNVLFSIIHNNYTNSGSAGQNPSTNVRGEIPNVASNQTLFYAPFASTPVEAGLSPTSKRIAYGSTQVWLNENFGKKGAAWKALLSAPLGNKPEFRIKTVVFLTSQRMVIGTLNGQVHRLEENTSADPVRWDAKRLDRVGNGLLYKAPITGIALDPDDASKQKFYVTIGGTVGSFRRVWYFNGNGWEVRSGPGFENPNSLLDVQYNAIVAVKIDPDIHLFAAADIGIWHSQDEGKNWRPFSVGIPESAVVDLKIFPEDTAIGRPWLLRAATYGRSVFERVIAGGDGALKQSLTNPAQLYIRTNYLDRRLYPAISRAINEINLVQPIFQTGDIRQSVDMKLMKSTEGSFSKPALIDFCEFEAMDPENMATVKPLKGRFYICIQTRGAAILDNVRVRLLLTCVDYTPQRLINAPPMTKLPANLSDSVQNDSPITSGSEWMDLGTGTVSRLSADAPLVASIDFPLVQEGSYFALAILDHPNDPFADPERNAVTLITNNRNTALSYFLVAFP